MGATLISKVCLILWKNHKFWNLDLQAYFWNVFLREGFLYLNRLIAAKTPFTVTVWRVLLLCKLDYLTIKFLLEFPVSWISWGFAALYHLTSDTISNTSLKSLQSCYVYNLISRKLKKCSKNVILIYIYYDGTHFGIIATSF